MPSILTAKVLTTLATLKTELNISSSTDDTYLERLINTYSDLIINYCGRRFDYSAAITETHPGYGRMHIIVERPPLSSITSIAMDGDTIDSENYEVEDATNGIIRFLGGMVNTAPVRPNIKADTEPGLERKLYSVVYKGGYVTPAQDGTGTPALVRDMPYDLEQACILACVEAYRQRGRDRTIKSETLMSASVTYAEDSASESNAALPPAVCAMLAPYRRGQFA